MFPILFSNVQPNAEFDVGEMDKYVTEDSRACKMNYCERSESRLCSFQWKILKTTSVYIQKGEKMNVFGAPLHYQLEIREMQSTEYRLIYKKNPHYLKQKSQHGSKRGYFFLFFF